MAVVKEHVLLSHPDKQVLLAEIPAANSCDSPQQTTVTLRLLVELCSDYGAGHVDVDTMEDVTCRVPLSDLGRCQGAAERAFKDLVARIGDPTLRPEVATQTRAAAARVRARCGEEHDGLIGGVEFCLRVVFIDDAFEDEAGSDLEDDDAFEEELGSDYEDVDEYGSDMEFDLSSAAGYEDDDDDEDGCGAQFFVRPYYGALAREGETTPLLSGFVARSDGPELTDPDELTYYGIHAFAV